MFKKRDFHRIPKTNVTTSISIEHHKIAQENKIAWSKALETGIIFLAADKDGGINYEYPESKLQDKLKRAVINLSEAAQELDDLKNPKDQEEEITKGIIGKELDEAFK